MIGGEQIASSAVLVEETVPDVGRSSKTFAQVVAQEAVKAKEAPAPVAPVSVPISVPVPVPVPAPVPVPEPVVAKDEVVVEAVQAVEDSFSHKAGAEVVAEAVVEVAEATPVVESVESVESVEPVKVDEPVEAVEALKVDEAVNKAQAPTPKEVSKRNTIASLPSFVARASTVSSRRASLVPLSRRAADGPPVAPGAVTAAVRATNPILDELLHALQLLAANDPALTMLDLKDCPVFSLDHGSALADALRDNTHLTTLNLCNARVHTRTACELAAVLRVNSTLQVLNLESNAIAPLGIKLLAESLAFNTGLIDVRLTNQKQAIGIDAEQTFAKSLAKNDKIIKLSLQFRDAASRNDVDRAIMRNKDTARKLRLAQK
ncbi:hypothetical protein BDR26DRAFT_1006682 [Obelidium mucronatum]|nr:hypothetical protein BDR26DRAFT_1006682 [Obelidium mucronatum]